MTGRVFSLVAIPLALVGHLLFWGGSVTLIRAMQQGRGALDLPGLILVIAGIAIVMAAVATLAAGSLGVIVVGAVQLLFSLALHVLPFDPLHGGFSPAYDLIDAVRGFGTEVGDGMYYYFPPGAGAIVGAVLLVAGLAGDRRTTSVPSTRIRGTAVIVGVAGILGILLAIAGGAGVYLRQLVMLSGADPVDLLLLYGGVVLIGATAYAARWSSAGLIVTGGVAAAAGLLGLAAPLALIGAAGGWQALRRGLEMSGPSGTLLLIGLVALVAGLAVRTRARRVAPAAV